MSHRHGQCTVCSDSGRKPNICKLFIFGIVRADSDHLCSVITGFHHKVSVRSSCLRKICPPNDEIFGVIPIPALRHICLLSPNLRRGGRQIGVPIIEAQNCTAYQGKKSASCSITHHRHRRNRTKTYDTVRAIGLDRIYRSSGNNLTRLTPICTHKSALSS
ncbi:hypothetical protein D1872_225300 [compost metagenome]